MEILCCFIGGTNVWLSGVVLLKGTREEFCMYLQGVYLGTVSVNPLLRES